MAEEEQLELNLDAPAEEQGNNPLDTNGEEVPQSSTVQDIRILGSGTDKPELHISIASPNDESHPAIKIIPLGNPVTVASIASILSVLS